jgi:cobalt-precorrin 5A hydrolase
MHEVWHRYPAIVCIMATGIVIRTIAPLLRDKYHDPAVVVCDELGQFAISLLSGHIGGANDLAERVAGITGGQAVITTASDVLGYTPLDLWCRQWQLTPVSADALTRTMGRLVDQGHVTLWSRYPLPRLPEDLRQTSDRSRADLSIDSRLEPTGNGTLLFPRSLVFGIGCNRGTPAEAIAAAVTATCRQHGLAPQAIARLASIDLKQDEIGLCEYARRHDLPLDFYTKDQLNQVEGVSVSPAVQRATGAKGVAEPAALLSAGVDSTLLVPKIKWPAVTTAVAEIADPLIVSTHKEATAP